MLLINYNFKISIKFPAKALYACNYVTNLKTDTIEWE